MKIFLTLLLLFTTTLAMAGNDAQAPRVGVSSQAVVTATVTSTKFLSQNFNRDFLWIQNQGAVSIIIKPTAVQSGSEGIIIVAGASLILTNPALQDAFWIKSASATAAVEVIEGTR